MSSKILIVEDEAGLIVTLRDRLRKEGYAVSVARDGASALQQATSEPFDLIVLDLMLPEMSGLTVCQTLRQEGNATPILMLTARRQTVDKVIGLRTGADDYLTKPFQMAELLARVDALLRRAAVSTRAAASNAYNFDDIHVDIRRTEVLRDGQPITLSAKEFQLLHYFLDHPGETLSRDELLKEVWGYGAFTSSRTVDVHVAWLRQKLEKNPRSPQHILTVVGFGYKFIA